MQYLQEWRGREKSRKRAAEESNQESSRKRTREDSSNGRGESNRIGKGVVKDQEYKIRGSAITTSKDLLHPSSPFSDHSPSSPLATDPLPSPPIIHPDRRANIFNAAPVSASAPLQGKRDSPQTPLSRSPEHINKADSDEQTCKYLLSFGYLLERSVQSIALSAISLGHPSFPSLLPFIKLTNPPSQASPFNFTSRSPPRHRSHFEQLGSAKSGSPSRHEFTCQ